MAVHARADGHNTQGITDVHIMLHSSVGVNTSSVLQLVVVSMLRTTAKLSAGLQYNTASTEFFMTHSSSLTILVRDPILRPFRFRILGFPPTIFNQINKE